MLFSDTYKIISAPAEGIYKDRSSKFYAYAYHVEHEEQIKNIINELKKEFYDATHHCYAYVLGFNQEVQKSNDDREPANTAGKPILLINC